MNALIVWLNGRPRTFARNQKNQLQFLGKALLFVLASMRGTPREIWVGDSHAAHFNDPTWPCRPLREVAPGRWVWWLGPKLMYTVGTSGFSPTVTRLARLVGLLGRRGRIAWVFTPGEIDIRCHLAPRLTGNPEVPAFPAGYVGNVARLVAKARARAGVIVIPVPPSETYDADPVLFPVVGTLAERADVHRRVRSAVRDAVDALRAPGTPVPRVPVLLADATDALTGPSGQMRSELTVDGCHTNDAGRLVIRQAYEASLDAA